MKKIMVAVALAAAVSACATTPKKMAWVRADGQPVDRDPQVQQRFDLDKTACKGEMASAALASQTYCPGGPISCALNDVQRDTQATAVAKGCMADRGYMLKPIGPSGQPVTIAR